MPAIERASTATGVTAPLPFTAREFRDAMGQFATGVVVISTRYQGGDHAMTANAFMSGSLEPPLILVSVARSARMHERIRAAHVFGVSVLTHTQQVVSNHFAGKPTSGHMPDFEELNGLPVVVRASVQMAADLRYDYPCGDHTLFVGEVRALRAAVERPQPLLFHAGRYSHVGSSGQRAEVGPDGFLASHECRW